MPSTHTSLHYHTVFSTKNREALLGPKVRDDLHAYLGDIVRGMKGVAYAVGGTNDHVHVFMGLKATHCLADVMRELKADSSKWLKAEGNLHNFSWQEGYGAFTVSAPDLEKVKQVVLNQEEHHRVSTFKEEYVAMLERGLIQFEDQVSMVILSGATSGARSLIKSAGGFIRRGGHVLNSLRENG